VHIQTIWTKKCSIRADSLYTRESRAKAAAAPRNDFISLDEEAHTRVSEPGPSKTDNLSNLRFATPKVLLRSALVEQLRKVCQLGSFCSLLRTHQEHICKESDSTSMSIYVRDFISRRYSSIRNDEYLDRCAFVPT
jgi:hypothetical protein